MTIDCAFIEKMNEQRLVRAYSQGQHANVHILVVDKSDNIDSCLAWSIEEEKKVHN